MKTVVDPSIMWCPREGRNHRGRVIGWEHALEPAVMEHGQSATSSWSTIVKEAYWRYFTVHVCDDCNTVWMEEREFSIGVSLEPDDG